MGHDMKTKYGMILISPFLLAASPSEWIEISAGQYERAFDCEITDRNEGAGHDLQVGQTFVLTANADEDSISAVKLTFEKEGNELVLSGTICESEESETGEDGIEYPGMYYQCTLKTGGGGPYKFMTFYGVQEEGWFALTMTKRGVKQSYGGRDAQPELEIDTIQGHCL